MSRHSNARTFLLVLIAAFPAAQAAALRCPDDVKTNIVYVKFEGCSNAQPGLQFDVRVGDEIITVSKNAATDKYWTGETRKLFVIKEPTLTVRADAMPAARAVCQTQATGLKHGPCVALFVVGCEPLWLLKLDKTGKATVRSQRTNVAIDSCPDDPQFQELDGPGEVELTLSEKLVLTIAKPNQAQCVEASIAYKPFRPNTPFKLSDAQLSSLCTSRGAVQDTHAQEDLLKKQALKLFPNVIFIKTLPKKTGED